MAGIRLLVCWSFGYLLGAAVCYFILNRGIIKDLKAELSSAQKQIKAELPPYPIFIVGDGKSVDSIEAEAQKKIQDFYKTKGCVVP